MTGRAQRPILFVDVDGMLIPYGTEAAPDSAMVLMAGPEADEGLLSRINPALGPRLLSLGCDLVWATGWEDEANEVISPRVGLLRHQFLRGAPTVSNLVWPGCTGRHANSSPGPAGVPCVGR